MKIKIYGFGWVGKAMKQLFPEAMIYDPDFGHKAEETCDVAFICVPTPLANSKLDISIVEDVVSKCPEKFIIMRSTVPPGTCDYLADKYKKRIVMHPEYLGETVKHPMLDPKTRNFLILGGSSQDRKKAIELYQKVYNANITIRQVSNYEAEVIKLSENRAIMFKVLECQELYDACQKHKVDYYTVRDAVYGDDPRFNLWFTFVYPDKRGANSKCIPKDVYAWSNWANEPLTKELLKYNHSFIGANKGKKNNKR